MPKLTIAKEYIIYIQEFNKTLEYYKNSLSNKTNFSNLNINEFIEFLQETNYSKYPFDKLEITLVYLKRNDSFEDFRCRGFFENLKNHLIYLKKDTLPLENFDNQLLRISKLLDSLSNPKMFIEDMSLLVQIIKELNVSQEMMFDIMIQINNHNLEVVNKINSKSEKPVVFILHVVNTMQTQ